MKVVILCGGQGTRAYPYSRRVPKALMPVAGLPIVEQVMRIYARQGRTRFVLAVGHLKEDILRYFRSHPHDWEVECVDTGGDSDTGERVRRCLPYVGERFHVTYCDGLGDIDVVALERGHAEHGGATLTVAPLRSQYGILHFDAGDRVTDFVEKPVLPEHWINAGFFVFDREAFEPVGGQNLEKDILPALAAERRLHVFRHAGFWRSMDTHKDQVELDALWGPLDRELQDRMPLAPGRGLPRWLETRYRSALRLVEPGVTRP